MDLRWCVPERNGTLHLPLGEGDSWFQPILCGGGVEGINLPWPRRLAEPTCQACIDAEHER